jgi:hypothetical protein
MSMGFAWFNLLFDGILALDQAEMNKNRRGSVESLGSHLVEPSIGEFGGDRLLNLAVYFVGLEAAKRV